ncbi:MAG: tRNA (adenosine(37)-N6)-threonylcarbamoyltransferase complex dimerization subunit type 1 TsaB [Burkholderiaceae bacterium]
MPIILAIETSSELASVALSLNGEVITRESSGAQTHSQAVLPMVRELLSESGMEISRCDAIAFGCGPGSFTGVRTACGLAQGLAFGAGLPVVSVVTLEAMAHGCRQITGADNVLPVLDARMNEVYWAQYRYEGEWKVVSEPSLSLPEAIRCKGSVVVCGNGFAAYRDKFDDGMFDSRSAQSVLLPHASHIVALGVLKFQAGLAVSAQEAQPLYLRNKVAFTSAERAARLIA